MTLEELLQTLEAGMTQEQLARTRKAQELHTLIAAQRSELAATYFAKIWEPETGKRFMFLSEAERKTLADIFMAGIQAACVAIVSAGVFV